MHCRQGGLVVSCQPVPDSPLDKPDIVAAMALAAQQAGAVAVRIEGINNLRAVRQAVTLPIIGIIKRDLTDSPVRITPYAEDVDALAQAGQILLPLMVPIVFARLRCVTCWRVSITTGLWRWPTVPASRMVCIASKQERS
jgi:hypothetical protein